MFTDIDDKIIILYMDLDTILTIVDVILFLLQQMIKYKLRNQIIEDKSTEYYLNSLKMCMI